MAVSLKRCACYDLLVLIGREEFDYCEMLNDLSVIHKWR